VQNDTLKTPNDSTATRKINKRRGFNFITPEITNMVNYQREHPKVGIDSALTVLNITPSFTNKFLYSRANKINSFLTNTSEENKKLQKEIVSYASISIFIFLPIFTLFLRFIYLRRRFTYVEHLIFVFHTQTVFFILLTIFYILSLMSSTENMVWIFSILFLIYLLIAMKKFYQQGYFKTFFKFLLVNFAFVVFGSIGFAILSMITFMVY
jgi:cation transport ATPase